MSFSDLQASEGTEIDFKESLEIKKPRSWLKSVSAFANTNGGNLVFGVQDGSHLVVGLEDPQTVSSKITELIRDRIKPAPRYRLRSFESDHKVCVSLEIQNGPSQPYYYVADGAHTAYVRRGDQSVIASEYELNNLILKGQNKTFDSLPTSFGLQDVSFTLFGATFKAKTGSSLDLPRDLFSMCLATPEQQVTNAGLLLSDQGFLPQSRIFCTRWKGKRKGTILADALDDREFQQSSIITLLQNAEDFVRANSKNRWNIRGMEREEFSEYPQEAVREALVNALIHRDYQILGSEIHLDIYDDRLEVTSPGCMPSGKCIQDMDLERIPSMRRNQIISDLFSRMHYMERRGSGIGRMLTAYESNGALPTFFSDENFFIVTLPNRLFKDTLSNSDMNGDMNGDIAYSSSTKQLIAALQETPRTTINELHLKLNLSTRQVQRLMNELRSQGKLVRIGSNRNGEWHIQ